MAIHCLTLAPREDQRETKAKLSFMLAQNAGWAGPSMWPGQQRVNIGSLAPYTLSASPSTEARREAISAANAGFVGAKLVRQ